jgi:hypothetical protein
MVQTAIPAQGAVHEQAQTHSSVTRVLLAVSIGLAFGGQVVLLNTLRNSTNEGLMQALASILLVAGAILFGAYARESVLTLPRLEFPPWNTTKFQFLNRSRRMVVALAVSVVLALVSCALFIRDGENQLVRLLWLASLAALLIVPIKNIRIRLPHLNPQERLYLALLGILLLVALATRVYNLTLLPYNVDGDFADVGLQARALANGQEQRLFAYGWAQVPMLGYLPAWLTMKLFGTGLAGLNASGVIEGLLLIVGVYLLGRDLFHARVGLLAAAVLTISYAHLAASRQSSYIDPVLFLLFAIYFLLIGLREGRSGAVIVSGLLTALCIEMYYSGRLVGFVVAFLLLYLAFFRRPWLRERWRLLLLWALSILITLGPMLIVFATFPDGFITRARFVFIFNPDAIRHLEGAYHVDSLAGVLFEQARRTLFLFHYYPDTGTQFGLQRPYLDPILAPLFMLGVGYAVFHWRRWGDALLLGWLGLGLLLGSFLALDPPFWTRLMILLPPTALLTARAMDLLYAQVRRALAPFGQYQHSVAAASVTLLIGIVGILNWNTYVMVKGSQATEVTRIGRYLDAQPPSVRGYLVSEKFSYDVRQLEFIAPDLLVASLKPAQAQGEIARVGSPTLLILTDEQSLLLERLSELYPEGSPETHIGNTPTEIAFYVFRLP